jgi:hypothetical protein
MILLHKGVRAKGKDLVLVLVLQHCTKKTCGRVEAGLNHS